MGNYCSIRSKESEYNMNLESCRDSSSKFKDKNFLPCRESLIEDWNDQDPEVQQSVEAWNSYEWIRISEIESLGREAVVFSGKIEPNDIKQGALGDCYFLSCLSVLTENPKRVRNLFVSEDVHEEGIYAVKMYKNGKKQEIVIDDYIPCKDGEPIFSRTNGKELWVILLEKAWAKLHSSYHRIIGGQAHLTLRDLTGAPSFEFLTKDDDAWDKILDADIRNYIMAAGVSQEDEEHAAKLKEIGLVGQHSYGLIKVDVVSDADGNNINLIKLRNPWGSFEWSGDWSDKSDKWTEATKAQVELVDENDGTFWMSFDDFKLYFSRVQICQFYDDYEFSHFSIPVRDNGAGYYLLSFQVTEEGHYTMAFTQKDQRCCPKSDEFKYNNCRAMILDENRKIQKSCKSFRKRDTYLDCNNLSPGITYLFLVEIEQADTFNYRPWEDHYVFSSYGTGKVDFKSDNAFDQPLYQVLEDVMWNHPKRQECLVEINNNEHAPNIKKWVLNDAPEGYNFVIIDNQEDHASYIEKVEYQWEGVNFISIGDDIQPDKYEIHVLPGQRKTILMRVSVQGYSISSSTISNVILGKEKLKELCLANDQKEQRGDTDIYVYSYEYSGGYFFLYKNETADMVIKETINYEITGLQLDGGDQTEVVVKIGPGEEQEIYLRATGKGDISMGCSMATMIVPVGDPSLEK